MRILKAASSKTFLVGHDTLLPLMLELESLSSKFQKDCKHPSVYGIGSLGFKLLLVRLLPSGWTVEAMHLRHQSHLHLASCGVAMTDQRRRIGQVLMHPILDWEPSQSLGSLFLVADTNFLYADLYMCREHNQGAVKQPFLAGECQATTLQHAITKLFCVTHSTDG